MNTDDRALADLIAELRGLLAVATKRPWARCYPSVDRVVTGGTLWCGQNREADEALIVATVNALPTLLDRLEAFHAKPGVGEELPWSQRPQWGEGETWAETITNLRAIKSDDEIEAEMAISRAGIERWASGAGKPRPSTQAALRRMIYEWLAEGGLVPAALQSPPPVVSGEAIAKSGFRAITPVSEAHAAVLEDLARRIDDE